MPRTTTIPTAPASPLVGFDRTTLAARLEADVEGRLFDPAVRGICASQGMVPPRLRRAEAFAALSVVTKLLHGAVEHRLEPLGLTLQHVRALAIMRAWGGDGPQLRAVAEQLRVTPRTVTAIVDGLEGLGLLERIPDPTDRRAVTARLTDAGRRRCEEAMAIQGEAIDELLGGVDDAELGQLRHLCYGLVLHAGDQRRRPGERLTETGEVGS